MQLTVTSVWTSPQKYKLVFPDIYNDIISTSLLFPFSIDNELVCDCRLAWIFDLRNRTLHYELQEKLAEIDCKMKAKEKPPGGRVRDAVDQNLAGDDDEYPDDESFQDTRPKYTNLLKITQKELPCPQQYRDHFEHPSTREFIGFDISWINSSALRQNVDSIFIFVCTVSTFLVLMLH